MALFNQIKVLTDDDIEDVTKLYADSCKYVEYFQKMFGKKDCSLDIYREFLPDVTAAIRQGYCCGIYKKGILTGILLSINWFDYKNEHPVLFNHMFNCDNPTTKILENYANQFNNNVYFIFAIGVVDGCRCQGLGRQLLRNYVKRVNRKATIFSDCLYANAQSLWLKEGFHIVDLTEDDNEIKVVVKLSS